jgi:hypothetical protein
MAARNGAGTDTRPLRSTLLTNVDRNNAIHSPYKNHFSHLHARRFAAVRDPLAAWSHACRNWDGLGYHGILWESMEIHWKFLEFLGLSGTTIESRRSSLESFGINVFAPAQKLRRRFRRIFVRLLFFSGKLQGLAAGRRSMEFHGPDPAQSLGQWGLQIILKIIRAELLEITCQTACKPGSVPGSLRPGGWPFIWDARHRTPRATYPDPTRERACPKAWVPI